MKVGQTVHMPSKIIRVIDASSCPDWLELRLIDAHGVEWLFEEKAPVVTCEDAPTGGPYLEDASIAGVVTEELAPVQGRGVVAVNTEKPWGIEATCGTKRFEVVFADSLIIDP